MTENAPTVPEKNKKDWKKPVMVGCLFLSILLMAGCLGILTIISRQNIPYVQNYFPTQTATPPHILVGQPAASVKITKEDFLTNKNEWSSLYWYAKTEVKDGKLFLESFQDKEMAIGYCNLCSFVVSSNHALRTPYYLQADFNTDKKVDEPYGLIFSAVQAKENSYYIFVINPTSDFYAAIKVQNGKWENLTSGYSDLIKPYPETNALSVEVEAGHITLYINGQKLTDFIDKSPLADGQIGFIAGNAGFKLIVDNLFAYHK